jgi:hypothetical protein
MANIDDDDDDDVEQITGPMTTTHHHLQRRTRPIFEEGGYVSVLHEKVRCWEYIVY